MLRDLDHTSTMESNQYLSRRPLVLGLAKILAISVSQLSFVQAAPFGIADFIYKKDEDAPKSSDDASLWLYLGVAAMLVLLGGAFAGLTIALMGQVRSIHISSVSC
jgi:metal transporter CNNM